MSNYKTILNFAREMRKNPTYAEKQMWINLRKKRLCGLKFNRQFIIEHSRILGFTQYYIADFHCHEEKLIIEIDGDVHLEQIEYDKLREETLKEMGFRIIRFKNEEVKNNLTHVLNKIRAIIESPK